MAYKWYKGVPHCHTTASDGNCTIDGIIKKARKNHLDFVMITDHNRNSIDLPRLEDLTLIPGAELTLDEGPRGHANFWGVKNPVDDYFNCKTDEKLKEIIAEGKRRGAVVCMNHPFCGQCPWTFEKNPDNVDVLEVWNSPTHFDNLTCTEWWHEQLRKGKRLPVVGGSDFHRDYFVTNLLTMPVTYVSAKSNSQEDILDAIKRGRTTICNSVGSTFIDIKSGSKTFGDEVKLQENTEVTINVKKLHKNHRLVVFDKDGICYSCTAKKTGDFSVTLPVSKKGFICAHVLFAPGFFYSKLQDIIVGGKIPEQKGMALPPLIYAQSGAIYFE